MCTQIELAALAVNSLLDDDVATKLLGIMGSFQRHIACMYLCFVMCMEKITVAKNTLYALRSRAGIQVENARKIHCAESFLFVEKLAQRTFSICAISVARSASLVSLHLFSLLSFFNFLWVFKSSCFLLECVIYDVFITFPPLFIP